MEINKINSNSYHITKGAQAINLDRHDFDFIKFAANKLVNSINRETHHETSCESLKIYQVNTINQNTPDEVGMHYYIEDCTDFHSLSKQDLKMLIHRMESIIDSSDKTCIDDANIDNDAWSITIRFGIHEQALFPMNICLYYVDFANETRDVQMNLTPNEFFDLINKLKNIH